MKKLIRLFVALVILLVVIVGVAVFMIDQIARHGIERGATYALGVDTKVDKADVGLMSGDFDLSGVRVSNPAGFTSDHFMHLTDGGMGVSLGTLMKETVEVPRFTLSGIDVHLEKQRGKANYQTILDNLARFESSDPSAERGKRFVIRDLVIKDVTIHINLLPLAGSLTKLDVQVPEIHLKDIGSDGDRGVVIAELTNILVKAILRAAVEKGGGLIPADLLGDLQGSLARLRDLESLGVEFTAQALERVGEVTKQLEGATKQVEETIDQTRKQVEEGAGKIIEGVGGLLRKKDDGGR